MVDHFLTIKKSLPILGIGLGLRRELADTTFRTQDRNPGQIDWLEFTPENYLNIGGAAFERLEQAKSLCSLISHGINLSIGSVDELNYDYLRSLKLLLDRVDTPWWSDHLCFSSVGDVYLHDLLPLPFTREALNHVVNRIRRVQSVIDRPFLIENISYYMTMPGSELTEAEFLSEVLEQADCGLLLDVNNVYVNSINHGFDAKEFFRQIPLERVVQIHIAGHKKVEDLIIDTHGAPIIEPVYELLRYVLPKTEVKAIMLERDQNFPEFSDILTELDEIRGISKEWMPKQSACNKAKHLHSPADMQMQGV